MISDLRPLFFVVLDLLRIRFILPIPVCIFRPKRNPVSERMRPVYVWKRGVDPERLITLTWSRASQPTQMETLRSPLATRFDARYQLMHPHPQ
jgi:hypothetical protein